jgi:hypothetical protein
MLQRFIEDKLRGRSLALVAIANEICADYARQGYDLTLRQLYYQFVARGHIPNTMRSYKSLAGLLDWSYSPTTSRSGSRRKPSPASSRGPPRPCRCTTSHAVAT